MALNYDEVMSKVQIDIPFSYTDADTMLYALCIGMGRDPLNTRELAYVYELGGEPRTVPTLATVLVPDMFPPDLGWDYSQVLHAEQRMQLYRPLPAAADLLINKRIVDVFDWGKNRGALFLLEAEGRLASDDTVLVYGRLHDHGTRRRRLWRTGRQRACAAPGAAARCRSQLRHPDKAGSIAALSSDRRPQPPACGSCRGARGGL